MKIGLPKIRFSRKVLLISVAMLALLAGSGAAALYVGAGDMLMSNPKEESPVGGECSTIQTLVLKTPAKRLWLRKYIRMDHATGTERIKTALRVAGLLAKANAVDLVQVSVLDTNGPVLKSRIRGRAIGAEVVIRLQPKYLPDMKEPFIVRYYEGMAGDEGIYYGERISLELPEIRKLVSAMKSVPDKHDCTDLPSPNDKSAGQEGKKPGDHEGKSSHEQTVGVMGETPAGHDAKPDAKDGEHDAAAKDAAPKKEPSFLDGVLGMVGLGSAKETPPEGHEAKAEEHGAPADDALEPTAEDHAAKPAEAEAAGHEPATAEKNADAPKKEQSFLDSMLGMVGLGGTEQKPAENHEAKTEDQIPVADDAIEPAPTPEEHVSEPADKDEAAPADTDADATEHQPAKAQDTAEKHVEAEPAGHEAQPVQTTAH